MVEDLSRALVAIPVAVQGGVESELEAPIEPPSPAFGAKGPDAVLKAARNAPPVEGFAARGVGKLAGALFWAQSIYNVLESDDKLAALAQVGVDYAAGTVEAGILMLITRSTPITALLTMTISQCGFDGGAACEEEKQKEAQARQSAELKAMYNAIGRYLEKNFPGSVEWVENTYIVHDKELWDETVKKVEELRKLKELEKQQEQEREHDRKMDEELKHVKPLDSDEGEGAPEVDGAGTGSKTS